MKDRKPGRKLEDDTIALLGAAMKPAMPPADLFNRVVSEIHDDSPPTDSDLHTIRSEEGHWIDVVPGVRKKLLHVEADSALESFLLQFDSGAELPAHDHHADELCLMLEGEAQIGDLTLTAGDFHLARRGTRHGRFHSRTGGMLFIQAVP